MQRRELDIITVSIFEIFIAINVNKNYILRKINKAEVLMSVTYFILFRIVTRKSARLS